MNTLADIYVRGTGGGFEGNNLIHGLIYLVVMGLIFYAVFWFVKWVGVPEPFNKVILVLVGLFALIVLINFLLSLAGSGFYAW